MNRRGLRSIRVPPGHLGLPHCECLLGSCARRIGLRRLALAEQARQKVVPVGASEVHGCFFLNEEESDNFDLDLIFFEAMGYCIDDCPALD